MKILVVKTTSGLKAAYDSDLENFKKIPLNEIFEIEYKKRRNVRFHRKFFSLINLYYSNQDNYTNVDDLRHDLLIVSGFYEDKTNYLTGEITRVSKSLKFSSMDEIEFNQVYEAVKNTISKLLSVSNEELEREVEQYF